MQIVISAIISSAISLIIMNHEVLAQWLKDISGCIKKKLTKQ